MDICMQSKGREPELGLRLAYVNSSRMVDVAESERAKEEILGERMAEDRSYRALNKKK